METYVRIDSLPVGKEFFYNSYKYLKISSKPVNPLIGLSLNEGLCAAVHVNSGEVHAFSKQMVEIEGEGEWYFSDNKEDISNQDQDKKEKD